MENNIKLALQWFKSQDIPAYEKNKNIYVPAHENGDRVDEHWDVQISTNEINYRAKLQNGIRSTESTGQAHTN